MKTETQIAEGRIDKIQYKSSSINDVIKGREHRASCQRFLEFLVEEMGRWKAVGNINPDIYLSTGELEEKITDLKQAIKLYEDAGI